MKLIKFFCQLILTVGLLVAVGTVCEAKLSLGKVFTDHMVLQQEMPIRVWGTADQEKAVTVAFNGQTKSAQVNEDGHWRAELPPMKADGKKHTLRVSMGNERLALQNVVLGEVWITAGQSNMNRETAISEDHPSIRLFWIHESTVPRAHDLGENAMGWLPAEAKTIGPLKSVRERKFGVGHKSGFAEVGWVFGRRLQKQLNVPVGLIKTAYGGSAARAWTHLPRLTDKYPAGQKVEGRYAGHKPGLLYQSMMQGLAPMSVRGVVWYQGENNGHDWNYDEELHKMIESWRKVFEQPKLPFYLAQIAQTTYASGMLRVWECQAAIAAKDPNVHLGMSVNLYDSLDSQDKRAVRIHAGNERDPATDWPVAGGSNPHPPNKHIVANRLADLSLLYTYKIDLKKEVNAPVYHSHRVQGKKCIVKFSNVGSGLKTSKGGAPNWFELSDGTQEKKGDKMPLIYHKASAKIIGKDTVEVSCSKVKNPVHLRFAWHMLARQNLENSAGIPVMNFRTDSQQSKQR